MKSARLEMPTSYWFLRISRVRLNPFSVSLDHGLKLVGGAQIEIGGDELRLRQQPRVGEVGRADLRRSRVGFNRAANAAPHVDRPGSVQRRGVIPIEGGRAPEDTLLNNELLDEESLTVEPLEEEPITVEPPFAEWVPAAA